MFGNRNGKRVLLVDDEPDITTVLAMALREFDYEVQTAKTVDEAIDIFNNWNPQFIVSDYAMPKKNGMDLFYYIRDRKSELIDERRFAFLSGSLSELEGRAALHGVTLIEKPVRIERLVAFLASAGGRMEDALAARRLRDTPLP